MTSTSTSAIMNNVLSRLQSPVTVTSYGIRKLVIEELTPEDKGRRVVYTKRHQKELGIISSWTSRVVFVRYTMGGTAAATLPRDLWLVEWEGKNT